jgi:hypothetical protein
MNKFVSILTFFLVFQSFADEIKFSQGFPSLYQKLITESYLNKTIDEAKIIELNSILNRNHQDIAFIESEIIKFTLNYSKKIKKGYKLVDHKMHDQLIQNLTKIKSTRPLTRFVYESFKLDLSELITDPELNKYNNYQKNKLFKIDGKTRKFSKKVAMLTPWIRLILTEDPSIFDYKMSVYTDELYSYTQQLLELTSRAYLGEPTKTKYISLVDKGLEKARSQVQDINFQVAPKPDPTYVAPQKLPQPVDDWVPVDETIIEDGLPLTKDRLFPKPDPDYVPPKVLPKPVDSW